MTLLPFESEIGKQFRSIVKSNNFITPGIKGYVWIKNGIAEVSYGSFMSTELWGVTVITNNVKNDNLCQSFNSLTEVEEYINKLNYESM